MLRARLGSIAMVARVRARRVGLPLRDARRERFGQAGCWPGRWRLRR
jgi:hypothetical protein